MARYRYRTAALAGPWRDSREKAEEDAVRAGQARDAHDGSGSHWIVPGLIEEEHEGRAAAA